MREIREDPLTGEAVALVTERPHLRRTALVEADAGQADCPFCPGHEAHTRPTIEQIAHGDRWVARAFANRWPVLVVEEEARSFGTDRLRAASGTGAHEVVVEAPEHAPLRTLPVQRRVDSLELAMRRMRDLSGDRRLAHLQWFRNEGVGAGASQAHPHAQIVGLPIVPERIGRLVERAMSYRGRRGGELLRDVVDDELQSGQRLLFVEDGVAAFCPFAPARPFEVWIAPVAGAGRLQAAGSAVLVALGRALHRVEHALAKGIGQGPLSTVLLSGPQHSDIGEVDIGWHLRLQPRWGEGGGLELATGLNVHPVFPEEAAARLREASDSALGREALP